MTKLNARRLPALAAACVLMAASSTQSQNSRFFDSAGVQIHYTDQGNGEPVVLIHAMLETLQVWQGSPVTRGLLDAGYRVLAFDVRPHGQSGKPHDPAQYGLEVVRDVVRLLDLLGLDRAHVVGYSMGGMLANAVRAEHPDRVATTVLGGNGWSGGQGVGSGIDADMLARGLDAAVAGADLAEFVRSTAPPGQDSVRRAGRQGHRHDPVDRPGGARRVHAGDALRDAHRGESRHEHRADTCPGRRA